MPSQISRPSAASSAPLSVLAILVLALLSAVAPLATDMYLPGFPSMATDLNAGATSIQMTLTGFLVGLAGGQLIIGPLSDRFGRRRPLLIGTGVAVLSALFCALTEDVGTLIALRFLQGIGGAAGVAIARAIVSDRTEDEVAAARLFQIMMVIGGIAPVLAPILGTAIVALFGWREVFLMIAFLSLLAFLGVLRAVGESLPPERRSASGLSSLAGGVWAVLGNRAYLGYTMTVGFSFMVMFAYISASPFVFQGILGLSPVAFALAFGGNAVGIAAVSAISAKLVSHVSPRQLTMAGLAINTLGVLATLLCVLGGAGAALMLPSIFIAVASLGLTLGNSSALAIRQVPENAGTASAALGALQFCLGALASPLVGLAGKDSALPMAIVMLGALVLALVSFFLIAGAAPKEQSEPAS